MYLVCPYFLGFTVNTVVCYLARVQINCLFAFCLSWLVYGISEHDGQPCLLGRSLNIHIGLVGILILEISHNGMVGGGNLERAGGGEHRVGLLTLGKDFTHGEIR
jgi:hypothetical protein